ncbi:MAG: HNH endonuclease [Acidimicrobiaceae bacterium]|nr:HNH endonuclease [Acidimicrobiaceae bacterium]
MSEPDDADRNGLRETLAQELRTIAPDVTYFAATLLGSEEGWCLSFQSRFAGWPDESGPAKGTELRETAPVYADRMTRMWEKLGQGWIAVTKPAQLACFLRLGGNALIAKDIARQHFASLVEPHEAAARSPLGFIKHKPDAREVKERAPTPKQRMRVLKRDGYRCQICGERPSNNEHIVLNVHHIRPFGEGGLTIDENLITLCHTCHRGLDPHCELGLFWLPGGHGDRALRAETPDVFHECVETYRGRVAPVFDALAKSSKRRRSRE